MKNSLSVISWNTYLAPCMYNRLVRKSLIVEQIKNILNYDIIHLQELNSWKLGYLGHYFYNNLEKNLINYPILMMILDFIFIVEGYIYEYSIYDNGKDVRELMLKNDYHTVETRCNNNNYVSNGLLSFYSNKFYVHKVFHYLLPCDVLHSPGILETILEIDNKIIRCYNLHLNPTLENNTFSYLFVNFFNKLNNKDTNKIRMYTYKYLNKILYKNIIENKNYILICGDFNENNNHETYEYFTKLINNFNLKIVEPFNEKHFNYIKDKLEIVDYIITNIKYDKLMINNDLKLSDHQAITANIYI